MAQYGKGMVVQETVVVKPTMPDEVFVGLYKHDGYLELYSQWDHDVDDLYNSMLRYYTALGRQGGKITIIKVKVKE